MSWRILSDLAREREALGPRDAAGWVVRLAKRVELLHDLGIVHGRISALAIRVMGASPTSPGQLSDPRRALDVPTYRSPERRGAPAGSIEDDVWAAAVTLYLLLTGELPFPGNSYDEVEWKCLAAPPAPLRALGVDDAALQGILDRAFTLDRKARTGTMAALAAELLAWGGAEITGLPPLDSDDDPDFDVDDEKTAVGADVRALLADIVGPAAAKPPTPPERTPAPPVPTPGPPPSSRPQPSSRPPPSSRRPPAPRPAAPMSNILAMAAKAPPPPPSRRPPAPAPPQPPPVAPRVPDAPPIVLPPPPPPAAPPPSPAVELAHAGGAAPLAQAAPTATRSALPPWPRIALVAAVVLAVIAGVFALVSSAGNGGAPDGADSALPTATAATTGRPATSAAPSPSSAATGGASGTDACVRPLFPPDTFESEVPPLGTICTETDPRRGGGALRSLVVKAGSNRISEGMKEWAMLGWYDMAAFAVVRGRCCPSPPPLVLPPTSGACDPVADVLNDLGAAVAAGAEAKATAQADRYTVAVRCMARGGSASFFGRAAGPQGGEANTFAKTLARAFPAK